MNWLNPLAWSGAAAIVVPILVHLLAHRRAERISFPTLRFLRPTRLAAIRRRALDDLPLLAVRSAIVVAAAAAFAGPLVVTPARRAIWNARLVTETVESNPLYEGIHRAVARLESAPPARRELVIAGPLTIGSLSAADLAAVPPDVGIRFTRTGDLPAARTIDAPALLTPQGDVRRTIVLDGRNTSVREDRANTSASWPIEIIAPPSLQRTADAAREAVLAVRVPVPNRRALLVLLDADKDHSTWGPPSGGPTAAGPAAIGTPWMADAVARIARDVELQEEAARMSNGLGDARFATPPWRPLVAAAAGQPVASAAASGERLIVAARAAEGDLIVPILLRAIANGLAPASDYSTAEIMPIADSQLRAWTRPPRQPPPPRPETVERDDRRWLWGAVLLLLLIETWMRRTVAEAQHAIEETRARVA